MTPLSNPLTADPITSILFWIDPEGRMLDASDGARRALGYDPVRAQLPTPLRSAFYLDVDATTFSIRDAGGRITHVGSYHLDVTNLKVADTKLRYHLGSEQALAETSALMIQLQDAQTLQHIESDRTLRDNARYLENLDRISRILARPERDADLLAEAVDRRWTDAEQRLFQAIAERASDALSGHLLLQQLQESEQRFAKAFRCNPVAMAISEVETGRFLDINEQWQQLLGYTREESIGHSSTELHLWADPGTRERLIKQLRASGFIREALVRFQTKAGDIRETLWSAETIHLGDQATLLSTVFDITEHQQTEARLRETLAHLERETRARQEREAELAQARKLEAIGRLTGGIAHDFNNLLTVIKGNLEILRERDDAGMDPDFALFVEDALSATRQGVELTAGLLAFSRQQPLRLQRTRVNRLVQGLERLLYRVLGPTTRLLAEIDPAIPDVVTDAGQLQAALLNLVLNAQDAMPEGGTLIVRTAAIDIPSGTPPEVDLSPGRYVVVTVVDSGIGMDADTLARACEPFFTTKSFGKGTGLGLATVHGFAAQSGGGIAIRSQPGQGTTVRLFLPALAPSIEQTVRENYGVLPLLSPLAPAERAVVILVVEDEARVRRLACRHLRDLGYSVLEAADAEEAIAILETEPDIQMVFSDIVMPGDLNGFDLANWIAAHRPAVKRLLATGHHERASDATAGNAPPLPVLRKPYSKEQLAHQIRQQLDERIG